MLSMIRFVSDGGRFDHESLARHNPEHTSLIAITEFPDGQWYIRDGLHRTISIYLGRSERVLYEDEYQIEHMGYEMYLEPAVQHGWYTPFDPRTEVRLADFFEFKNKVLGLIDGGDDVEAFIRSNKHMYATPRSHKHTIAKLAEELSHELARCLAG